MEKMMGKKKDPKWSVKGPIEVHGDSLEQSTGRRTCLGNNKLSGWHFSLRMAIGQAYFFDYQCPLPSLFCKV